MKPLSRQKGDDRAAAQREAGPVIAELLRQQRELAAMIVGEVDADGLLRTGGAAGAARIDIYRHAFRARLTEALRSNYPVLHRILGDDDFTVLAHAYLAARPSRQPSIRWFGDRLVEYLEARPDGVPHPALADLARMEWALGCSFDGADAAPLSAEDLIALAPDDWPQLRFRAHPSASLLVLNWAVEPVWRALTDDERAEVEPPQPLRHELLIWRSKLDTRWRSVETDEAELLRACLAGQTFAAMCAAMCAALCERVASNSPDQAAAHAAGLLRRWIDDGLLISFAGGAREA